MKTKFIEICIKITNKLNKAKYRKKEKGRLEP